MSGGLKLTYMVKSQVPVLVKTGEILREQLKKVGITLEVQPLESGQYFEALVGKKFDIAGAWWSVTVDPDMFYYPHAALVVRRGTSRGFKSEEADKRLDAFRFTATRPRARGCIRSWCKLVPGGGLAASSSATRSSATG